MCWDSRLSGRQFAWALGISVTMIVLLGLTAPSGLAMATTFFAAVFGGLAGMLLSAPLLDAIERKSRL